MRPRDWSEEGTTVLLDESHRIPEERRLVTVMLPVVTLRIVCARNTQL